MAGKFINTEHKENIDSLVQGAKEIIKNPYYKWNDKSGTTVTYFNQNKEKSTLDESTHLYYQDVGLASPIYYNMIKDFMIYGIEQIAVQMTNDDFGPTASEIEGDAIILPNTIIQYVGDYFNIDYTDEKLLFRITDATPDTLENGSNIYKVQYKLESASLEEVLEEENIADKYHMIINNVGTGLNTIIRDESYDLIKALEKVLYNLRLYYKSIFYNYKVQNFIFCYMGRHYYDPFIVEFLKEHEVLSGSDDEEFMYITHSTNLSALFPVQYRKSFFACLEEKDTEHIRSYEYRGVAHYIDQPLSIFSTRMEDYYEVDHDVFVYSDIIPCFKDEMITAIENNTILGGEDSIYNIIIKYMNNNDITQEDITNLDKVDFVDSIYLYYAVPCILYCIEKYIASLMNAER